VLVALTVAELAAWGWSVSPARAQATCMNAEGAVVLRQVREGCASAVQLCLAGTVGARGGFLEGATWFLTVGQLTGDPPTVTVAGETVITARTGRVSTRTEGTLDHAAGRLSLVDRVATAQVQEPRLMGARELFDKGAGVLTTRGTGSTEAGFQSEITGEICLSK
jgi:hypothetical protein